MSSDTKRERLEALAKEYAKDLKSQKDLDAFANDLLKITVEAALGVEMADHLGYEKHAVEGRNGGNSRNGYAEKTLKSKHGQVRIQTPRDREGSFQPQIIGKGKTRLTHFDDQILCLYAKGMSTEEIVESFKELYGADVSSGLISQVTDAVLDQISEWQNRPLEELYPILYLDCIMVKVRQDRRVINKAVYVALGVDLRGQKELLGLWISESEGASFWLSVLTELKNRGVQDVLIACIDGLTGFAEAIETVFPQAQVQLCIVHMLRNSLRYVSWRDRKEVARDLAGVYRAASEQQAELALEQFAQKWDDRYHLISKQWRQKWMYIATFFNYPESIRRAIYTTNAIESLNSVLRMAIQRRRVFPTDRSAVKVLWLAAERAAKKWTMPVKEWRPAINHFAIVFGERITKYL